MRESSHPPPFAVVVAGFALGLACLSAAAADDAYVVEVEGHAVIDTAPDLAWISMGVEARDPDVQAASARVAEGVRQLLALTRGLGIPDEHVSTAAATIQPQFDWDRRDPGAGQGPRLVGYVVQRQIGIRLDDIELIGRLTEGAVAAGVNNLSGAVFDTSRRDELEREALGMAVRDARRRAEALAAADGVTVGRARRLSAFRAGPGPVARM
jgi:uncharacterized protein YggE